MSIKWYRVLLPMLAPAILIACYFAAPGRSYHGSAPTGQPSGVVPASALPTLDMSVPPLEVHGVLISASALAPSAGVSYNQAFAPDSVDSCKLLPLDQLPAAAGVHTALPVAGMSNTGESSLCHFSAAFVTETDAERAGLEVLYRNAVLLYSTTGNIYELAPESLSSIPGAIHGAWATKDERPVAIIFQVPSGSSEAVTVTLYDANGLPAPTFLRLAQLAARSIVH